MFTQLDDMRRNTARCAVVSLLYVRTEPTNLVDERTAIELLEPVCVAMYECWQRFGSNTGRLFVRRLRRSG